MCFFYNYTRSFFSNFSGNFSQSVVRSYLCIAERVYYLKLLMAVRICLVEKCYAPRSTVTASIGQDVLLRTNGGCFLPWTSWPGGVEAHWVIAANIATNLGLGEVYSITEDGTTTYMRLYVRGNLLCINF